jgi:AbrB family looped-hinge helix DNA binding protein
MPRVTQKGQVTIPKHIRSYLGIKTGDNVVFDVDEGAVLLRKPSSSHRNFEKYLGFLSHLQGEDPDEITDDLRGGRL